MIVERLERSTSSIRVGVAESRIDSVRTVEECERAARVYAQGRVGLASASGDVADGELVARARRALDVGVPYAPSPEGGRRLASRAPGRSFDREGLVAFGETVLAALRLEFPDLELGNAISHASSRLSLVNEVGLELSHHEVSTAVVLTVRAPHSTEPFDTVLAFEAADPAPDAIVTAAREHLGPFRRTLDETLRGPQRVIFRGFASDLAKPFANDLLAPAYRSGDSLFAGGLESGRRLLSERFTLVDRRDPASARVCPFDHEGVVRTTLDLRLFDGGVLRALASDKRSASRHGVPATGCAVGGLAELPGSGISTPDLLPTAAGLADLLDGEPGVLVWLSMGGAWTPGGDLAMPAQVALRLDAEGRPLGRLRGVTLRGKLDEMFGANFLGVSEETIDPWTHQRFVGVRMLGESAP